MAELSSLSNEELAAIAGVELPKDSYRPKDEAQRAAAVKSVFEPEPDLSQLSNEQLMAAAGIQPSAQPSVQPVAPQRQYGAGESFIDNLAQGAFGLGDEASAGLAALYMNLAHDKPLGETYDKGLAIKRNDLVQEAKQNPLASFAGTLTGGVGLGVGGARMAGNALSRLAPGAAQSIGGAIAANPIKSTAGASALQGALYGFGTGQDSPESRLQSAALGGGIGLGAGGLLGYGGKVLSDKFSNSALAKLARDETSGTPVKSPSALAAVDEAFVPTVATKEGELFSKTVGQRSQNADIQRLENSALAGNLSTPANQAMKDAITVQNNQFKDYVGKLAGNLDNAKDANSLMEGVAGIVKTSADDAWGGVNNAYKIAREGGGVKVSADDIKQGLFKNVAALRREQQYDLSQMPQAKSVVKRLGKYASDRTENKISAVKLNELENWRTMATTAAQNAQGSEQSFLRGMVRKYDDFMESTASNAVDAGDAAAINAFKSAVKSRRDYGNLYEGNRLVEEIVSGAKSLDDVTQDLFGVGAIKGRKEMANNLDAILKASGQEAPAVQRDLQQAFAHKIIKRAEEGFAPDSQDAMISPAKLRTELQNLFVEQRDFATKLYGKDAVQDGLKAIEELKLISKKQPKVGSSSGSGEMIEGLVKRAGTLSKIPFLNEVIVSTGKTMSGNKVVKGLDEFRPFEPESQFFRAIPAISGGNGALAAQPLRVTVTPEDK